MVDHLVSRRHRSNSLSLAHSQSQLLDLPAELIYDILEVTLQHSKAATIASVSKTISEFIDYIIYRTVVLDSSKAVQLFHRTIQSKSPHFLSTHIKKLVLTWSPIPHSLHSRQIWTILTGCTGLRVLVLPSGFHPLTLSALVCSVNVDNLCELTVNSYSEIDDFGRMASLFGISHELPSRSIQYINNSLTHLRITEPGHGWNSPAQIIESLGFLPNLSHLQLPRRTNANEENDIIFVEEIADLLATRKSLKMIVVTLFGETWEPSTKVIESGIWNLLLSLASQDPRLVLQRGEYDKWCQDYIPTTKHGLKTVDFWDRAEQDMRDMLDEATYLE